MQAATSTCAVLRTWLVARNVSPGWSFMLLGFINPCDALIPRAKHHLQTRPGLRGCFSSFHFADHRNMLFSSHPLHAVHLSIVYVRLCSRIWVLLCHSGGGTLHMMPAMAPHLPNHRTSVSESLRWPLWPYMRLYVSVCHRTQTNLATTTRRWPEIMQPAHFFGMLAA